MWSQFVEYLSTGNCRISESELSPVGKVIKVFLFKLLNKQLKEGYITTVQYNENVNKLTPDIEINKISAIHGHEKTKKEKKLKRNTANAAVLLLIFTQNNIPDA